MWHQFIPPRTPVDLSKLPIPHAPYALLPIQTPMQSSKAAMFRYHPAHAVQRTFRQTIPCLPRARFLSSTPFRSATKGAEDKDTLKPTSSEYSKSGSDDGAAHTDTAFDPSQTRPAEEEASAERQAQSKDNSLSASPANKDISQPNSRGVGGNGGSPAKKQSGAGSAPKNGS